MTLCALKKLRARMSLTLIALHVHQCVSTCCLRIDLDAKSVPMRCATMTSAEIRADFADCLMTDADARFPVLCANVTTEISDLDLHANDDGDADDLTDVSALLESDEEEIRQHILLQDAFRHAVDEDMDLDKGGCEIDGANEESDGDAAVGPQPTDPELLSSRPLAAGRPHDIVMEPVKQTSNNAGDGLHPHAVPDKHKTDDLTQTNGSTEVVDVGPRPCLHQTTGC